MNKLSKIITEGTIFFLSFIFISCDNSQDVEIYKIEYNSDIEGISLGKFNFMSSCGGDVFTLSDGREEIVPAGAALSTIRPTYWIGFYDQGGYYKKNGKKIIVNKIFFMVTPDKGIEFYAPWSKDNRFFGDKISEKIIFNEPHG